MLLFLLLAQSVEMRFAASHVLYQKASGLCRKWIFNDEDLEAVLRMMCLISLTQVR